MADKCNTIYYSNAGCLKKNLISFEIEGQGEQKYFYAQMLSSISVGEMQKVTSFWLNESFSTGEVFVEVNFLVA